MTLITAEDNYYMIAKKRDFPGSECVPKKCPHHHPTHPKCIFVKFSLQTVFIWGEGFKNGVPLDDTFLLNEIALYVGTVSPTPRNDHDGWLLLVYYCSLCIW